MLLPLSDLRDPFAFLQGARIPLRSTFRERVEWIVDDAFYRIEDSFECDSLRRWLDEDEERPTGIDWDRARTLSLDLADPDVARWVDRKIAEVVAARILNRSYGQIVSAILGISRKAWVVTALHEDGRVYPWGFYREETQALLSVPVAPANIPAARAALTRAIFGKVAP